MKAVLVLLALTLSQPASADLYCPRSALPDTDSSNLEARCHPGDVILLEAKRIGLVLAGNFTILGSIANLIVVQKAAARGIDKMVAMGTASIRQARASRRIAAANPAGA